MPTPPRPTRSQQRILAFADRANRRLRGHRTADSMSADEIVEHMNDQERTVQTVHPRMVASSLSVGWLGVAQGNRTDWEYRVAEAGITAANLPARGERFGPRRQVVDGGRRIW